MNCNNKPYTITHVADLDIDDLATIPDYFLGIRAVESPSDGNTIYTPVRVPGARVMPTGNLANVTALDTNNTTLEIPENQVRGGYYDIQPGGNNGKMLVQTTGFLTIPAGHQYIVGQDYYLGENGEPVTDSSITGQRLFTPLNEYILNVNMEF